MFDDDFVLRTILCFDVNDDLDSETILVASKLLLLLVLSMMMP